MIPLTIDAQPIPRKGDLLLSEPFLMDNHFTRSVILVCEHNAEGSFGLILNNSLDLELHSIIDNFPPVEVSVGFGGPVERNQLFYIHKFNAIEDSAELGNGFYIGGDYTQIIEGLKSNALEKKDIRFYIGYTGWSAGQLEEELLEKTWIVLQCPDNFDFSNYSEDHMWKELVTLKGGKYKRMAEYPINPADN